MRKSNHVVSSKTGGWAVKKSGAARAIRIFPTKEEAKKFGVEMSKKEKTELYIHKSDGSIQNRSVYGDDPVLSEES
jgi:hypothetical protein